MSTINLAAVDSADLPAIQERVAGVLRERHRLPADGSADDFQLLNQADFLATLSTVTNVLTALSASRPPVAPPASTLAPPYATSNRIDSQPKKQRMNMEITNHTVTVDGLSIHYLQAGGGDPLVLLHGFPQHSHMWRRIMPALANRFTVIAPDLRGMGGSSIPAAGYDKRTMAADLASLIRQLGLGPVHLAGYDLGGGTAYAYAGGYPDAVRRLAMIEYVPPGFGYEAGLQPTRDWQSWQLAFFTVPDVAAQFIAGKERELLAWYFWHWSYNPEAVSMADFELYVRQLQKPGALRAGFSQFAAVFDDTEHFKELARRKLSIPVLALGGERGAGGYMVPGWRQLAEDVRGGMVPRAGHWVVEEQPEALVAQLLAFFGEER